MKRYLLESELNFSRAEKQAFLETLRSFSKYDSSIRRQGNLKQITEEIGNLVEAAEQFTLKETDGWFDNVTTSRDMKGLRESYKLFEKTAKEASVLQQRLEACYEDIGSRLQRYYDI